jgi:hypothetical protein
MTLEHFQLLDELEQIDQIISGVCIGGRDAGIYKILLFQVSNFYVEVYFNKHERYITRFAAFDDMDKLEPYLSKMPSMVFSA